MSEYEYFTNSPYTNYCKWKGYLEREERQAAMMRIGFYRIHQSLVQKPLSIQEFMPLPSDKKGKAETKYMSKEMWQQLKKRHLK